MTPHTLREVTTATNDDAAATTAAITRGGVVAVLRSRTAEHYLAIADALVNAGIRTIEITLSAGDAIGSISTLTRHYGGDAVIGAGTVTTADETRACIDAGASFLVSPATSAEVIRAARDASVAVYPGTLTPTEMMHAVQAGASGVKLFPASAVTPRYISDVHGPMPDVSIMPTGGIAIADIAAWLSAGASAVGVGSPLLGSAVTDGVDAALLDRARSALDAVTQARERA